MDAKRLFNLLKSFFGLTKNNAGTINKIKNSYHDFTSEIVSSNGGTCQAYTENGMCVLRLTLPAGVKGAYVFGKIPEKYRPRWQVAGAIDIGNTSIDAGKIANGRVFTNGDVTAWILSELVYTESIYFCYPMIIEKYLGGGTSVS